MSKFKSGQSGNPGGRPKGALNRATLATQALLDGEAGVVALHPLPHLLGAGPIQFFQPADLPLLEDEFDVNPFIQATQAWSEAILVLHPFARLDLCLTW